MNLLFDFIKTFRLPYKSREDIRQYQLKRLREVVTHAYESVPFYQQKYNGLNLTFSSLEDIRKLPVVSSEEMRNVHIEKLTSKKAIKSQLLDIDTTGTSGSPLRLKVSKTENARRQLNLMRFMLGYGWLPWWKGVFVWRKLPSKKYSFFQKLINSRRQYIDIGQPIEEQVKRLKEIKPKFMHGMLSSIEQMADWLIDHNERLSGLIFFTTGGEVKRSHHQEKFNKAFGMPGLQRYGATECGVMGYACMHCTELCFDEKEFLVEVVDDFNAPVKNGEKGKVLFTALNQFTTPLIRYDLGDLITLSESQDRCKNRYTHFKSIDGRVFDALELKDGRKLHSQHLRHVVMQITGLKKLQFILKKDGSLLVKYIVDDDIGDEIVRQEVFESMNFEGLEVNFERCKMIPNEPSGKFKFLKTE